MIGNVKIMMLKGEKGDQGEAGSGVYDDTEVRGLIEDETQTRAGDDAALDARVGILAGDIATIETSPTTASHNDGELIVYNDQLYIVISAIASGEALVVDTNIAATSIGESIGDINDVVNGMFKTDSFSGTTSAGGNVYRTFSKKVYVLAAWTESADTIVFPYPVTNSNETGAATWWFHVRFANAAFNARTELSFNFHVLYVDAE